VQVFVPYPSLKQSVMSLDPSRLGNQIYRECLTLATGGWPNHPVAKMWKHHTFFLCKYALNGLLELQNRGLYYPHIFEKFTRICNSVKDTGPPIWWGNEKVHNSHKANLLRKDYTYYSQFGWQYEVNPADAYYYPTINEREVLLLINQRMNNERRN